MFYGFPYVFYDFLFLRKFEGASRRPSWGGSAPPDPPLKGASRPQDDAELGGLRPPRPPRRSASRPSQICFRSFGERPNGI